MEQVTQLKTHLGLKEYLFLMKPGIIMGNSINAFAGFALASKGHFNSWLLFSTLVGLALVVGSGCIFNNIIDRKIDKKMKRTENRVMANGHIQLKSAILFALFTGILGLVVLAIFTNFLTTFLAFSGLFLYVGVYSFSKYRTHHSTLIGSLSGAIPPIIGYCAVKAQFDLAALILFFMIVMWQMPHFFAIGIYRLDDYIAASIPIFPVKKGIRLTKIQMLLYVFGFLLTSSLLTVFHFTGTLYLTFLAILGAAWLSLAIKGFFLKKVNDQKWARQMFLFSLIVVMGLSIMIPLDVLSV